MSRVTVAIALLVAGLAAAPAASQHGGGGGERPADGTVPSAMARVLIGFDNLTPARLDIVTGDAVSWTNDSVRVHTVTADDGSFDSGRLTSSRMFGRRFVEPGTRPYHCTLHPFIRGVVDVHDLLLAAPSAAAAPRRAFALSGRTALPGGTRVSIEADSGAGFSAVASATADDDGRFATTIVPTTTASYRAVAGELASPPVQLLVLDRSVSLTTRRARGRIQLRAHVTPPANAGRVVLQLFLPERFGWWPVRKAKLGNASGATFTVHTRRRLRARVRYTLADGATALATSRVVHVGPAGRPRHR